ncbi:MAG: hypothetical protein WC389_18685 [Lutibacter sp.]|jgi:hypothetical protein
MKLPKLNLCASKDELRHALQYIAIDEANIVATDGHIVIKHSRSLLNFIEDLPALCFVKADQWVEFTKEFEKAIFVEKESHIILTDKNDKKRIVNVVINPNFTFPNYNTVIPDMSTEIELTGIGINPELLLKLAQASSIEKANCKLHFFGLTTPIIVDFYFAGIIEGVQGVIMPILLEK